MDIDIDFADRQQVLDKIEHRKASLVNGKVHNTGIYISEIPHNPLNNTATIDYKLAEERGYFKIDFLNVNIYKMIRDEEHLIEMMNKEPEWELLQYPEFTDQVFQISGHSELFKKLKPGNIEQLAAVLAIIRPSKRYLEDHDWDTILKEVWVPPADGGYYFKKSHSFSYAFAVVVHMNLICEKLKSDI